MTWHSGCVFDLMIGRSQVQTLISEKWEVSIITCIYFITYNVKY